MLTAQLRGQNISGLTAVIPISRLQSFILPALDYSLFALAETNLSWLPLVKNLSWTNRRTNCRYRRRATFWTPCRRTCREARDRGGRLARQPRAGGGGGRQDDALCTDAGTHGVARRRDMTGTRRLYGDRIGRAVRS